MKNTILTITLILLSFISNAQVITVKIDTTQYFEHSVLISTPQAIETNKLVYTKLYEHKEKFVVTFDLNNMTESFGNYVFDGMLVESELQEMIINYVSGGNPLVNQKEVVVKPIKSIQQIKEERANLIKKETKITSGTEVFESPITAIYERFSKKVKSKQKVAELTFIDDQRKVLKEILRTYVAYEIIELGNEEFDDFISFLNIDANFLRKANDIELVRFIKDKFDHYKSENPKN